MNKKFLKIKPLFSISIAIPTLIITGALSITGCFETVKEIPITCELSASAFHFPFAGDEQSLTVNSNTISWEVTTDASWITITSSKGAKKATVTIRATANTEISDRKATIIVSGTGILTPQNIYLTQAGNEPAMVRVEGGTFIMGCTEEQGSECNDNEIPSHSVTLSTFEIGKYEVTYGQWIEVMRDSELEEEYRNYPITGVSWNETQEFITHLNSLTGKNYRLPTEAEWEYAARGGRNSKGYKYSGSNTIDDVAWYNGNSDDEDHIVGLKAPNELGLYDMSGNVWELCSDWYGSYSSSSQTNPSGPSTGSYRVCRGGGYSNVASSTRVSYRINITPDIRYSNVGFRLARSSN